VSRFNIDNFHHSYISGSLSASIVCVAKRNIKTKIITFGQSSNIFKLIQERGSGESILPESKLERKDKFTCTLISVNVDNFRE